MKCAVQVLVLALLAGGPGCEQKNKELDAGLVKFTQTKEAANDYLAQAVVH